MEEREKFTYRSQPTLPEIHPADSVVDADLRFLFEHWKRLKGARQMPARSQISPKDIKQCLRCVHLYEVVDSGADFRARLVGSGVYPNLEEDQTGRLISEHPDPGVRLRFATVMRRVVEEVEPLRSVSLRTTGSLLNDARTEGLWLPLGGGERVEHVLAMSSLRPVEPGTEGFATDV